MATIQCRKRKRKDSADEQEWNTANLLKSLQKKEGLCELHTHLLGMGNASFWVDTILTDRRILPTQDHFMKKNQSSLRRDLGPLIWNDSIQQFIGSEQVFNFFGYLSSHDSLLPEYKDMKPFCDLISEEFEKKKDHHKLTYKENFSYDVVFSLENMVKGLGLKQNQPRDMLQCVIEEKLGIYTRSDWNHHFFFKYWIIFNAREQKLEIIYGMQAADLRMLIGETKSIDKLGNTAKRDARAHIINAFSMMNSDGTEPRSVDFHSFRGAFTPEFYPRRFALKDSLYTQRLDLLVYLLQHVLHRYSTCVPPVKYCEFSVGCGDLTRPWMLDVLSTFCIREELHGSFKSLIDKNCFPWLKASTSELKVDYRFLAGFNRQIEPINDSYTPDEAIPFLFEAPHFVIHALFKEFYLTDNQKPTLLFRKQVQQLKAMKTQKDTNPKFLNLVVGLDALGDELGHPCCPFVAHEFIEFVRDARKHNRTFGVRIHAAENAPFIRPDLPGYRLFAAHMYILYRCIDFLKRKLQTNIRVGHGIAFDKLLSIKNYKFRKSSVLVAQMKRDAKSVFSEIPFEVNITSNFYLLGGAIRNVKKEKPLSNLYDIEVPVVLSTDNDGILPIDRCDLGHYSHHSLAAEYCRAIVTRFISKEEHLDRMIQTSFNSRFAHSKPIERVNWVNQNTSHYNKDECYFPTDIIVHPTLLDMLFKSQASVNDRPSVFLQYYRNIHSESNVEGPITDYDKIMMRLLVAFFYLMRARPYKEFKEDYENLFPPPSECKHRYKEIFTQEGCLKIYEVCKKVHSYLMTDTPNRGAYMEVEVDSEYYLFCSEVPNNRKSKPTLLLQNIKEFMNKRIKNIIIFSFLSSIDENNNEIIENLQEIDTLLRDPSSEVNKVFLYTNTKKDLVFPFLKSGKIFINNKPSMRTDATEDEIESVLLYAICPHSSVVTSCIHFIAKHIHKKGFAIKTRHVDFRYLVIPFLPLNFGFTIEGTSENPKTQFLQHFHISGTNFAKEVVVREHDACEQLYERQYNILCADIRYQKQIETKDLLKEIGKSKFDFLNLLRILCGSIKNFSLWPAFFVILNDVNEYNSYTTDFGNNNNNIPVPIIQIDQHFLICSCVNLYERHHDKWSSCLWSLATSWNPPLNSVNNPHAYPYVTWTLKIFEIGREKLNKEFGVDTWEELLTKVLLDGDQRAWYSDTVNYWCDVIEKAFRDEENVHFFVEFLKKSDQSKKLLAILNDGGRHKLGNQWQLDVIEKRQAKQILNKLKETMEQALIC
ncbi:unnamed protein product [Rotaria socialis]|uniref:Uncharacterized protein n=1 Tax=Rotaria socialis TaxID=392032 RepID=A0A821NE59_9BILA|nr:unnamed protein product [Rotaria socialis]CAF3716319.1 unnamed protein product [Rotaria socialis]CAF4441486.1 unnamed protein product [Rotaria socialis]CAF4783126.1 unnamed protein product [Rotaria socialis]